MEDWKQQNYSNRWLLGDETGQGKELVKGLSHRRQTKILHTFGFSYHRTAFPLAYGLSRNGSTPIRRGTSESPNEPNES